MEFFMMFIKLILSLIVIFGLMALLYKGANKTVNSEGNKKYTKVLERVQISKDGYIVVVKMGSKGMILSTSANHTEKLKELNEEEIIEIEEAKINAQRDISDKYNLYLSKIKSLIGLKEEKHE